MGLFEKIFKRPSMQEVRGYFKTLSAYTPVFTTYEGGVYEMELTRAAIHAFATQCSKLKPEIRGNAYKELGKKLQFKPNSFMDTTKFLYRLATILCVQNTAFIVPIMDDTGTYITGYYPILPSMCEVVEYQGQPWLRYTFSTGQKAAIEFEKVGIMTQFQYKHDFFGENNAALYPTMQLMHTQNQGILEGVKQSANIRFMAKLANIFKASDIAAERKRFTEENLSAENNSGVLMFDNKYADVKQIISKPFIIDSAQVDHIKNNVYSYFGVNESILQNKYTEDEFNAFYEGKIESFALQLGLVMTNMTFTEREIAYGNQIMFSSSRLQYASNKTKLEVSQQLFDRGILSRNEIREIWQLPPLGIEGDKRYIRLEYADVENLGKIQASDSKENSADNNEGMV
ncbi:MAG TPA: phage portal protein [Sedimentibacter sp.]|nr:phage portal protein [Sedimentibacter sp.]